MMAHAEGPGRIVLETTAAIQARVWAAAPTPLGVDTVADVRTQRNEDNAIANANFVHRAATPNADTADAIGAALLTELGL